jgi:hypothetical protein
MAVNRTFDKQWVRGMFGLAKSQRGRSSFGGSPKSTADFKFADSTIGGNEAINPPYQFTRFADIKATGLLSRDNPDIKDQIDVSEGFAVEDNAGSFRQGRDYSENYDDVAQYVHFRWGVPKYSGTVPFFANMYSRDAAILAKRGEYTSLMRGAGKIAGISAMFVALPAAVIIPFLVSSKVLGYIASKKTSRYFYLKPAMNLYLQSAQAMADTQLMYAELLPMWEPFSQDRYNEVGEEGSKVDMEQVYSMLPDIWKSSGKFDLFRAINRFQILANYQAKTLESLYSNSANEEQFQGMLNEYINQAKNTSIMEQQIDEKEMSLHHVIQAYASNPAYRVSDSEERAQADVHKALKEKFSKGMSAEGITDEQISAKVSEASKQQDGKPTEDQDIFGFFGPMFNYFKDVGDTLGSELRDGGQWVTFRVNGNNSVSDSFSNTTKQPEIAEKLNSMSATARSIDASTSGGKTGFDLIDSITTGIKDFMGGALSTLNISGLAAIYGSSYVDIQDVYESSTAETATESFTIPLGGPYGNDLSRFQDITLPIILGLAGALPMSTGKQTYNSPLLCECYFQGRMAIRTGIIESIQLTRGTGNMGWRPDGKMLAAEMTITVRDLSRAMHMPIIRDPSIFDDDNKYTDYMATIGGASLHQMTYALEKVVFNLNRWKQSWKSAFMSGRHANSLSNTWVGRGLSAFTKLPDRGE